MMKNISNGLSMLFNARAKNLASSDGQTAAP